MDVLGELLAAKQRGDRVALVTVVETRGSTPRKPGARMLVYADGRTVGTIGGGSVEHEVAGAAQRVLETGEPRLVHYKLTAELAMCCGGQMTFFVEPVMNPPPLIVFGCGHVGSALIYAAAPLGFRIIAVDDAKENANPDRLPPAEEILNTYDTSDLEDLPFGEDTYVVIATRDHGIDQRLLEYCVTKPTRYLGCIGAPRKAVMQRERLAAKGVTPEQVDRVRCPIGLDIGALTPEEIAVAICAELVALRRGGARFAER